MTPEEIKKKVLEEMNEYEKEALTVSLLLVGLFALFWIYVFLTQTLR